MTNPITEISQWGIWQCKYKGRTSYHPTEEAAREQLDMFRREDDLYGDERRLEEAYVLIDHLNCKTQQCNPSVSRVAGICNFTERAVRLAFKNLENEGLIFIERKRGGNKNLTNTFKFRSSLVNTENTPEPTFTPERTFPLPLNVRSPRNNEENQCKNINKKNFYPEGFEELWNCYPRSVGGNPKQKAFNAYKKLLKEHGSELLLLRVKQYAQFCEKTGRAGTEYVKQACSFFGRDFDPKYDWEAGSYEGR